MNIISNLVTLFILFSLTSCAVIDVDFHMPNHRFMSPETAGEGLVDNKFAGHFVTGMTKTNKVTLAEAYDALIFNASTINEDDSVDPSTAIFGEAALGVIPRLDLFLRLNADSPAAFGIKYQFLGDTRLERKRGWKGAVAIAYGSSEKDEGQVTVDNNGSNSRVYEAKLNSSLKEVSLIFGNRVSPSFLIYLSSLYSHYEVDSTLSSNSFATVSDNGVARNYGGNLGLRLDKFSTGFYFTTEAGVMRGTWENSGGETNFSYGLAIGLAY